MPKPDGPQFVGDDGAYLFSGKNADMLKDSLVFNDEGTKIVTHPIDRIMVRAEQAFHQITNDLKKHVEPLPPTQENLTYLSKLEKTASRAEKHGISMINSLTQARFLHDMGQHGLAQQQVGRAGKHMANFTSEYVHTFNTPGHPLAVSIAKNLGKVARIMYYQDAENN